MKNFSTIILKICLLGLFLFNIFAKIFCPEFYDYSMTGSGLSSKP